MAKDRNDDQNTTGNPNTNRQQRRHGGSADQNTGDKNQGSKGGNKK